MPSATEDVSLRPTPSSTTRPRPISPATSPCTITRARLTRWITARIIATEFSPVDQQYASQLFAARDARSWLPILDKTSDPLLISRLPHLPHGYGRCAVTSS